MSKQLSMRIFYTLVLFIVILIPNFAKSQAINVKGKVLDSGSPFPNVFIRVKGTGIGTTSDKNGDFSLSVSKLPLVLVFSAVGYYDEEFHVTKENSSEKIQITMRPHTEAMSEVVVLGYSASKRSDMVGATSDFSSVEMKSIGREKAAHKMIMPKKPITPGYSRILTAGELNDFKKWKLWGDYNESEFSAFTDQWLMTFRKRYCVQVQDTRHKPIVGEKLYLINEDTRDTVWQAVSDNTGKAELWADNDDANGQSNYSINCSYKSVHYPITFENGINRIVLKKDCAIPKEVDLAFVVDATGSMGDEIAYLQAELQDIIEQTADKYKGVNLRLGSVFYRDRGDEYVTRTFQFQSSAEQLAGFIKKQSARGGGDFPEAVEEALQVAIDSLQWNSGARTKILFLVLDAPPHDAAKGKMKTLIQKAAAMGIRIVPIACSGINKSTEYLMRCAALATNGSYIFLTDDSGVGNPHIKPTTDEFKVELLNELLQRLIGEMIYAPACDETIKPEPVMKDTIASDIKVLVFPNPTQGRVTVESSGTIKLMYVTDFTGKLLMKLETSRNKRRWQVHLASYPSGTYLIKYFVEENGWHSEKVVLIH